MLPSRIIPKDLPNLFVNRDVLRKAYDFEVLRFGYIDEGSLLTGRSRPLDSLLGAAEMHRQHEQSNELLTPRSQAQSNLLRIKV